MQGFSKDEFRQRLDKAQFLMREQGMDLMLLTAEPEVRYFSGFFTQFWLSPTRPWFLLIPDRGYPVAVIPEIGEVVMRKTWVRDIRTWSSPQPADEGISLLSDTINEMVGGKAVIGLSKGHESVIRMPLNDLESLRTQLPGMRWMNCTPLIRELRMEKSPAEVAKIRHICQIASDTFDQASDLFEIGQPLDSVFRAFKIAMLQNGADDVPYLVGGAGQGGYSDVISPPSQVPIEAGDILMLDTGSTYEGYYCDFDRNVAFGHASDAAKRAYQTLYQATEAGLAIARPGATCAQVYQAMQSVIEQAGGGAGGVGRMGHGLGMQLTEWPSNMASDHTVIMPNMVLTLEPSMGLGDGKMMVHEENILITEYGPEMLSRRAAPELPII
jgi:Xaa-Pro aminopeptidase